MRGASSARNLAQDTLCEPTIPVNRRDRNMATFPAAHTEWIFRLVNTRSQRVRCAQGCVVQQQHLGLTEHALRSPEARGLPSDLRSLGRGGARRLICEEVLAGTEDRQGMRGVQKRGRDHRHKVHVLLLAHYICKTVFQSS